MDIKGLLAAAKEQYETSSKDRDVHLALFSSQAEEKNYKGQALRDALTLYEGEKAALAKMDGLSQKEASSMGRDIEARRLKADGEAKDFIAQTTAWRDTELVALNKRQEELRHLEGQMRFFSGILDRKDGKKTPAKGKTAKPKHA